MSAILLEEMSFHTYTRFSDLWLLMLAALVENFGYRQLVTLWRLLGLLRFMVGAKSKWGDMKRSATWQQAK